MDGTMVSPLWLADRAYHSIIETSSMPWNTACRGVRR